MSRSLQRRLQQGALQNQPLDLIALREAGKVPMLPPPGALQNVAGLNADALNALVEMLRPIIWKKSRLLVRPFLAQAASAQILPEEDRSYFMIQNMSGAQQIVVNFGREANPAVVPIDGFLIGANLGFYEPLAVPQDAIHVAATAANTPGVIVYARV